MDKTICTTLRLKIRNLRESDLDAFYHYRSNPEIAKYQGFDTFTRTQARIFLDAHAHNVKITPGEWVQFGIEKVDSGELIGDCAVYLQMADSRIAEIGITISHMHHRRGYAKECMRGLINYLFQEKGVHRIIETVDTENIASIRMLESLSFRQEAHFIESIFFKGKWGSEYQYAMLKKEWKESGLADE